MTQIALVEALALVNAGGWMITQRNRLSSGGVTSVTNAEIVADVLTLRNGAEVVVSVGIDRLSVEVVDVTSNSVGGFRLVFDNGRELSVELDGGDTWDAWIKVVTGKEEFDFR